jgi:multiple RNA-binding domain-containing protein 1
LNENEGKILFIMNLNFKTKEEGLKSFFNKNNFYPLKIKIITHKKNDNVMSSGYGFAEFKTSDECENCIKKLQGQLIDDHSLKLSIAKPKEKKNLLGNKRKQETELNDVDFTSDKVEDTKILVKNIAFEATKEEIRKLFKGYGELKNVRLPTKLDGQHRGFCFIEFVTHDEAKNAFKKLQNTHFYGRKLVFEWAQKEKTIEDLRENTKRKLDVRNISTNKTLKKSNFEAKKLK